VGEEPKAVKNAWVVPIGECDWPLAVQRKESGALIDCCINNNCDHHGVLLVIKPIELEVYDAT